MAGNIDGKPRSTARPKSTGKTPRKVTKFIETDDNGADKNFTDKVGASKTRKLAASKDVKWEASLVNAEDLDNSRRDGAKVTGSQTASATVTTMVNDGTLSGQRIDDDKKAEIANGAGEKSRVNALTEFKIKYPPPSDPDDLKIWEVGSSNYGTEAYKLGYNEGIDVVDAYNDSVDTMAQGSDTSGAEEVKGIEIEGGYFSESDAAEAEQDLKDLNLGLGDPETHDTVDG
jgi:hypothetical protein